MSIETKPEQPAAVTDSSSFELGVLAERERCARIAEEALWTLLDDTASSFRSKIAAAIRSGK